MSSLRTKLTNADAVNEFALQEFEIFDMTSGTLSYDQVDEHPSSLNVAHDAQTDKAICHAPEQFPRTVNLDEEEANYAARTYTVDAKTLYKLTKKVRSKKALERGPFHVFEFVEAPDDCSNRRDSSRATSDICQLIEQAIHVYSNSDGNGPLEINFASDSVLHTVKVRGVRPSVDVLQRGNCYPDFSNVLDEADIAATMDEAAQSGLPSSSLANPTCLKKRHRGPDALMPQLPSDAEITRRTASTLRGPVKRRSKSPLAPLYASQ
ncbi:hypothetical protein AAVH_04049 [Aphelenchoides avenae]|nr:hypothetical protein AAVH_04049 [Aphelenchus avenae]